MERAELSPGRVLRDLPPPGEVGFSVILHLGAKARDGAPPAIPDPTGLLRWLGKDRAIVRFAESADIESQGEAFAAAVTQWIAFV